MTAEENWKIHVQFAQKETNCCPFNSRGNFKVCIMSNVSHINPLALIRLS